jgi:CPA2 family monovalent cation:H+ antiporter-2
MSLAQIGEFSFIIAALGLSLGATREFLYPVAVTVSAITVLTTPWLVRASGPIANLVDRKMPRALQTFVSLYASWVERLRSEPRSTTRGATIRHLVRLVIVDVALLAAIAIGTSVALHPMAAFLEDRLGLDATVARVGIVAGALALAVPLGAGVVRVTRQLGLAIGEAALPSAAEGRPDLSAAPRRALVVTLQLAIVLLTGLPLLAVTQPFLGGVYAPFLLAMLLVVLGFAFWRGAADLQGHVRAGAQAIVEALIAQARRGGVVASARAHAPADAVAALRQVHQMLPGLGEPTPVELDERSPAVGKSLADLNLRGSTGATVLAIARGAEGLLIPTAKEILRPGDILALAGSHDAVDAARSLLLRARADAG